MPIPAGVVVRDGICPAPCLSSGIQSLILFIRRRVSYTTPLKIAAVHDFVLSFYAPFELKYKTTLGQSFSKEHNSLSYFRLLCCGSCHHSWRRCRQQYRFFLFRLGSLLRFGVHLTGRGGSFRHEVGGRVNHDEHTV
jgi:hypothetical protein